MVFDFLWRVRPRACRNLIPMGQARSSCGAWLSGNLPAGRVRSFRGKTGGVYFSLTFGLGIMEMMKLPVSVTQKTLNLSRSCLCRLRSVNI